jgi:hypothetical protein
MHPDDLIPLLVSHPRDRPVTQDSGIIDENVEASEIIDGVSHQAFSTFGAGYIGSVGHSLATLGTDLLDHFGRDALVSAFPGHGPAHIVDHHACALASHEQGMFATDSMTGTCHNGDAAL